MVCKETSKTQLTTCCWGRCPADAGGALFSVTCEKINHQKFKNVIGFAEELVKDN